MVFPSPSTAVANALQRMPGALLAEYVAISLLRVALGFTAGGALGIVLAVAGGWYRTLAI